MMCPTPIVRHGNELLWHQSIDNRRHAKRATGMHKNTKKLFSSIGYETFVGVFSHNVKTHAHPNAMSKLSRSLGVTILQN